MNRKLRYIVLIIWIIILAILISCKSKKLSKSKIETQTETNVKSDLSENSTESSSKTLEEKKVTLSSEDAKTVVDIEPVGHFMFTLEDGFSGEAKSVKVTETRKEVKKIEQEVFQKDTTARNEITVISEDSTTTVSHKEKNKAVEKKPTLIPWIGAGILFVILILLFWYLYRKRDKLRF